MDPDLPREMIQARIRAFKQTSSSKPSSRSASASWESIGTVIMSGSSSRSPPSGASRSRSSTQEVGFELALLDAVLALIHSFRGADPATIREHQQELREMDALRPLPLDIRLEPNYMTDADADADERRIRRLEVIGTAPPLLVSVLDKKMRKRMVGVDVHPACVRYAVVAAGFDQEGAIAAAEPQKKRVFRSERRSVGEPLPLTGRKQIITAVGSLPRLVGGQGDPYVPDPRLRSWLGRVTRFGYKAEFNPRRRRRIRGLGRDRYVFRVVEGTHFGVWGKVMGRMYEDRNSDVGRARGWGRIYPTGIVMGKKKVSLSDTLRPLLRRLVGQERLGARVVGMMSIPTDGSRHSMCFEAHLVAARRGFYGDRGVRLVLTVMNPHGNINEKAVRHDPLMRQRRRSMITPALMETLARALTQAMRQEGLLAPAHARPAEIRRGDHGVVFVDRLAPAAKVVNCDIRQRRMAVQYNEPSCGPSSFALMLAAARLAAARLASSTTGRSFCTRAYAAVGDEDVVLAAQLHRQA
jgi:hypothetical protein